MENSVAILGFGKTGKALLDFIIDKEIFKEIILYNDTELPSANADVIKFKETGVKFLFGEDGFKQVEKSANLLILSPGINGKDNRFDSIRQRGIKIISEIEFAYNFLKEKNIKIIALTGTNGKSTTVSLIHHFLKENGYESVLAGNIGNPLISEVKNISNNSYLVLELSSFQLEEIIDFKPFISTILNITSDHLDRYGDMKNYINAKINILKNQNKDDYFIFNYDDEILRNIRSLNSQKYGFSLKNKEADSYIEDTDIFFNFNGKVYTVNLNDNPLRGIHNLENIIAATTVAIIAGVNTSDIEFSLKTFKGLEHRMELCGRYDNVEFINDSKATNIDATLKSAQSFDDKLVIILGGKDKGGDFKELDKILNRKAEKILLIGDAAKKIYNQFTISKTKSIFIDSLDEAVLKGYDILKNEGGVVLLAPACASFDMFENFEDRGRKFKIAVKSFINGESENKNG